MNRREFFASSIGFAGAAVLGGHARNSLAGQAEPGPRPKRALMKLGCQRYGSDTREDIEYYQRHRVEVVNRGIGRQSVEELVKVRERLSACGLGIIGRLSTTMDYLKAGQERDAYISTICDEVRRAGEAGITAVLYNFPVPDSPHYTHAIPGRGRVSYDAWDLEKARKNPPVNEIGSITAERSWEGITYFLERVVPVADKYKVRLASHPMDPPYPGLRRTP